MDRRRPALTVSFVLDTSVAASWFLNEPDHPHVGLAWRRLRTESAVVPSIWWYEIRNVLLTAERRRRLAPREVDQVWDRLGLLRIDIDPISDDRASLQLARRHGLTFYDATFVELAKRLDLPFATRDRALTKAARAERIALIDETA